MTREELKEHCVKQIEMCEMWAISKGEKPSGKIYEEHKLILELLEQESVIDKVKEVVAKWKVNDFTGSDGFAWDCMKEIADIVDKGVSKE